ncbi:MAG: hypothetical protein NZ959_06270 [Armatimonadetes bacterium]|nr:hypothetical protein [Armatimonadota bacterium]MDW8121649.1 sugar-binding protein [Armatimonadota bacterium]
MPYPIGGVNEKNEVVVPIISEPIVIDGRLDEPVWASAPTATGFRQFSPRLGDLPTRSTTVKVLANTDTLFVAFICELAGPNAIRAYETRYDADMERDERVVLILDTLHNHEQSYRFTVNARNNRSDERFGNERWNAEWQSAVQVTEKEWVAEIAIPFSILTYDPNQPSWGIGFDRYISETQEMTRWAFHPDRPFDLRFLPHLVGLNLENKAARPAFQQKFLLKAFTVAQHDLEDGDAPSTNYGLDGEWLARENASLRFVVKPDFSEVEESFETIDVTYVEQFLQDLREFFVQGREFFDNVATPPEPWRTGNEPSLFYSRRVARFDTGLKFTGGFGSNRVGILATQDFDGRERVVVADFNRTFGVRSRGFFGMAEGIKPGANSLGFVVGGETLFGPDNRFSLSGSYARNFSSDPTRDGGAGFFRLRYGDERWFFSGGFTAFGPGFQPLFSFTPRTDFQRWGLFVNRNFRPRGRGAFRQANLSFNFDTGRTFDDRFFNRRYGLWFWLELHDRTQINLFFQKDKHAEYYIRPQPFDDWSYTLSIEWGGDRPFRGEIGYSLGRAFDGTYRSPRLSFTWDDPKGDWRIRLNFDRRYQDLPGRPSPTVSINSLNVTKILGPDQWVALRYFHRSGDFSIRNFALTYRIKRQNGTEVYFIWGDPRSRDTKNRFALKWIFPFSL